MYRRWRVRHSYPTPVVDFVTLLMSLHGVPEISRMLDIPKSVIYRWRAQGGRGSRSAVKATDVDAVAVAELIARCEELGFRFAERVRSTSGPLARPLRAAWQSANEAAQRAGNPAHAPGDGMSRQRRVDPAAAARFQGKERADACAAPATERESEPGNPAHERKERPSRGVRSRLEAVRLMLDRQYYLDWDSHTLAETARMSRHHFIRTFSGMFGMSPHRYLTRARINAAKRLLLTSREPIEVIAVGVGFRSGPSFNRAFKQIEGAGAAKFSQTAIREFDVKSARAALASGAHVPTLQQDD